MEFLIPLKVHWGIHMPGTRKGDYGINKLGEFHIKAWDAFVNVILNVFII